MQLFRLINALLANDPATQRNALNIKRYCSTTCLPQLFSFSFFPPKIGLP